MRPGRPTRRQCRPIDSIFGAIEALRVALRVQHVERVLQVGEELLAAVETLRRDEAHVVGVERVGHDQQRRRCPAACARAPSTEGRRRSRRRNRRSHRARPAGAACWGCRGRCTSPPARSPVSRVIDSTARGHVFALDVFVDLLIGDPAPAVTRDLVAVRRAWPRRRRDCAPAPCRHRTPSRARGAARRQRSRRQTPARDPYS